MLREQRLENQQDATPKPVQESRRSNNHHPRQKDLTRLEKSIAKLTGRRDEIHAVFSENTLDPEAISKLSIELDQLQQQIETLEEEWMMLADEE